MIYESEAYANQINHGLVCIKVVGVFVVDVVFVLGSARQPKLQPNLGPSYEGFIGVDINDCFSIGCNE